VRHFDVEGKLNSSIDRKQQNTQLCDLQSLFIVE